MKFLVPTLTLLIPVTALATNSNLIDSIEIDLARAENLVQDNRLSEAKSLSDRILLAGTIGVSFKFNEHANAEQRRQGEAAFWEATRVWDQTLSEIGSGGEFAPKFVVAAPGTPTDGDIEVNFVRNLKHDEKPVMGLMFFGVWNLKMFLETHGRRDLLGRTVRNWRKQFLNIALHELGHAFGLDHFPTGRGNVMGAVIIGEEVSAPSAAESTALKTLRDRAIRAREAARN